MRWLGAFGTLLGVDDFRGFAALQAEAPVGAWKADEDGMPLVPEDVGSAFKPPEDALGRLRRDE